MLETGALSPEVKKLFADIAKQSEQYSSVFKKIDQAVSDFEQTKSSMEGQLGDVRNEIDNAIIELKNYANKSVNEFKKKTDKTYKLFLELDKIDKLKNDLFNIRDEIKTQSIDLSNSLVEFNAKADQRLESTINVIRTKLNNTIEEEIPKIETKVARRLVNFEGNQKVFEKRILGVDQAAKAAASKLSSEVDYVYNSITEIKSDLSNYMETVVQRFDYFDEAIPKILEVLESFGSNLGDLRSQAVQPSGTSHVQKEAPPPPPPPPTNEEDFDESLFDFESTTFGDGDNDPNRKLSDRELMKKIQAEFEDFDDRVHSQGNRQLIALSMGAISFIGLIILIIIQVV